jgi:thiol-disulfide isomerase/thioredoxin
MNFRNQILPVLMLCLALAACKPDAPGPVAETTPAVAATESSADATAAAIAADVPVPEFPKLTVKTFDGGEFDLAAQRGRWVVVNYWATWCNPCLKEIPDLDALDKAREDVVVIGLAYEEIEKAEMQAFLKAHPISYPIAVLDVYAPPADFGTPPGLPMTFLIDPQGRVASRHLGPVTSQELEKEIAAAKAKPAS